MAATNMTLEEMENLFRAVTLRLLNLPEADNKSVRFPYGSTTATGSAPGFKRMDDVCFLYVLPEDGEYAKQSNISYRDDGADRLTHIDKHTDIYRVNFVCYGPCSFEWAKTIRGGIIMQDVVELLVYGHRLALVERGAVQPVRELKDGEWWTRHDLSTQFYHGVQLETENYTRRIEHVNINPHTERST